MRQHFKNEKEFFPKIKVINLIDQVGKEQKLGEVFKSIVMKLGDADLK